MELADRQQCRHEIVKAVWDFFEGLPYFEMRPRQDLVSKGHCLAWPGRQYLVYLEEGGIVDVQIEKGSYLVTWINARDTTERRAAGTTQSARDLQAPDQRDWLLLLTRTSPVSALGLP